MTRPVTPATRPKISTWLSAFCPTVASSTSSTAWGALGVDFPHHPDDLLKFAHELRAVLQSPGGVHEHDVDVELAGARQRVEGEACRVGALVALDERGQRAPRPDAQLLDRGGAKGVARREQDRLAFGPEFGGELADGRRLARAVDADDEDHERALRGIDHQRAGDRLKRAFDLVREDLFHFIRIDAALVAPVADRVANAGRRGKAEVGLNENVLEIVERGGVELALGENVGDAARDRR